MTDPMFEDSPILSNGAARALWTELLPYLEPRPRSLYMIFLDDAGRPLKQLIPIDDLPNEPDPEFVEALARVVDGVTADGPATWVLLALVRAGEDTVIQRDRAWAELLHGHLRRWMNRRPVVLATAKGVRAIWPDWQPPYLQRRSSAQYPGRPITRRR
jgi:hypothetical protein